MEAVTIMVMAEQAFTSENFCKWIVHKNLSSVHTAVTPLLCNFQCDWLVTFMLH